MYQESEPLVPKVGEAFIGIQTPLVFVLPNSFHYHSFCYSNRLHLHEGALRLVASASSVVNRKLQKPTDI